MNFDLDKFLTDFVPADESFTVMLENGWKFSFRHLKDYGAVKTFEEELFKFHLLVSGRECPPALKDFDRKDLKRNAAVFILSELSVEPKLDRVTVYRMLAAGQAVENIIAQIETARKPYLAEALKKALESGKDDSGPIPDDSSSSSLPVTSTGSTPTN